MPDKTRTIPLTSMEKILLNAGASRVSEDAKSELKKTIEKKAAEISGKAVRLSRHAKRNTVMDTDIKLAISKD
jgi:histone H3/H4